MISNTTSSYLNYLIYVKRPLSTPNPRQHFLHVLVYSQHEETVNAVHVEAAKPEVSVLLSQQKIAVSDAGLQIDILAGQKTLQGGKRQVELPYRMRRPFQRDFQFQVDHCFVDNGLVSLECIIRGLETQRNVMKFRWGEEGLTNEISISASGEHSVGIQNNAYNDSHNKDCYVSICSPPNSTLDVTLYSKKTYRAISRWCHAANYNMTCFHIVHLVWPLILMVAFFIVKNRKSSWSNRTDHRTHDDGGSWVTASFLLSFAHPSIICLLSILEINQFPVSMRHFTSFVRLFFHFAIFACIFSPDESNITGTTWHTFVAVPWTIVPVDMVSSLCKCGIAWFYARIVRLPTHSLFVENKSREIWSLLLHAFIYLAHYICIHRYRFRTDQKDIDEFMLSFMLLLFTSSIIVIIYLWKWTFRPLIPALKWCLRSGLHKLWRVGRQYCWPSNPNMTMRQV